MISIIVPVLNEAENIAQFLDAVYSLDNVDKCEIIVVDGDPNGSTISGIKDDRVICITSPAGRGKQLNTGADFAKGDILLFLHADTALPKNGLIAIENFLTDSANSCGAFELGFDSDRFIYKWITFCARIRYRHFALPYGDQAIFMRKDYFEKIGQFAYYPFMEDVDIVRRIKKRGDKIPILPEKVFTSVRRWEKQGKIYGTLRNAMLLTLFCMGVAPEKLKKFYR